MIESSLGDSTAETSKSGLSGVALVRRRVKVVQVFTLSMRSQFLLSAEWKDKKGLGPVQRLKTSPGPFRVKQTVEFVATIPFEGDSKHAILKNTYIATDSINVPTITSFTLFKG